MVHFERIRGAVGLRQYLVGLHFVNGAVLTKLRYTDNTVEKIRNKYSISIWLCLNTGTDLEYQAKLRRYSEPPVDSLKRIAE